MSWRRVRELIRKEFIQLFRDRRNRPLLVIAPLIQLVLFGYVVTTDVRDIRMALIDLSRTPESRRLADAFDANPSRAPRRWTGCWSSAGWTSGCGSRPILRPTSAGGVRPRSRSWPTAA